MKRERKGRVVRVLSVVMVVGVVMGGCSKVTDYEPKPLNLPQEAAGVITADNTFGFDLYTKLAAAADAGTNLMISPLSVSQALSMTWNGAAGETKTAMEEALGVAGYDRDDLNKLNKTLITALVDHDQKVEVSVANSIWYRQEYTVLPDFISRNQTWYDAEVRPMDFTASGCKDVINNWVSDKTNKKITEIVDQINPESFMYLINATYFKGAWTHEFSVKKTSQQTFYKEDGTTLQVDMMHQELDLNLYENETFASVELPYGKGNWRMFLFLPVAGKDVTDVEKLLSTAHWEEWLPRYDTVREVQISLPKFTFAYDQSLKDALSAMGMGVAFTDNADFTGILPEGGLLITDVKHKTFIEVNEEGTEAAAVTSVEVGVTSIGNSITFNRPFLFAIAEKSTGAVLFIGRLMNPE